MDLNRRSYILFLSSLTLVAFFTTGGLRFADLTLTGGTIENFEVNTPNIDGAITAEEYSSTISFSSGDYQLYWQIEENTIYFGIIGNTIGWVAIGFEPTSAMKDADMIFAWVESNGTVVVFDAFSTGNFGPHPPDTDLGGTTNILAFNGSESSGKTTIEFSRLLTTGDQYDNAIPSIGVYDIIWAMGTEDNFGLQHSKRGSGTINLSSDEGTSTETHTSSSTNSTSIGSESTPGFEAILVFLTLFATINIFRRKLG